MEPFPRTLSTHLINPPCRHTLSTYQPTLSTRLINLSPQSQKPTLSPPQPPHQPTYHPLLTTPRHPPESKAPAAVLGGLASAPTDAV